jgi:signal transduction histidine kinase/FixJ family two-component response regulator
VGSSRDGPFDVTVWEPALEKFGAVTHLTVALYDHHEHVVCGPLPSTPLFALFEEYGYAPGILSECARQCLAQAEKRPAVIVAPAYGLAVVGTSLVLDEQIVGAAVAGYALVDFTQSSAIASLARHAGIPFRQLWDLARQQQPVPQRRLVLHGELLQVLGDALLRENRRTRQYEDLADQHEETAARLKTEMAAKDEFLAVLSHELRTPLTPILGWVRILQEAGDSPDHRRKAAASIERNALLQIKLVDDLLDLNRVIRDNVPLDIGIHDLSDLLRSVLDTLADTATDKHVDVELAETSAPLMVEGDAGRLQQVFANVVSNALKFTPSGGRVTVAAASLEGTAVVRISDSGEGIAPAFLPHIFEMFRQQEQGTRRRHQGLGIGLAVVKRLVELHRGQIDVVSGGLGCGTTVTIRLPLSHRAAAVGSSASVPKERAAPPFTGLTILLVEDTEDSLDATRVMLEVLGAHVLVARDGVEALAVMTTSRPDLVLCDLRMPRMDGFEFLRELCRIQGPNHPPVVAVSGLATKADRRRTEAAGFEGHINKPFDDTALVSAVQATLEHDRARQSPARAPERAASIQEP